MGFDFSKYDNIKQLCKNGALRWTNHIFARLLQRNISMNDIEYAIINGEIIESYPDDYPYPSCLILGKSGNKQYLHVVCGITPRELYLITAYYPDPDEWTEDFKMRKEKK
ncbi:MAG: DUF4258 domain-containing protein [Oscillospiraceae bacterium]|nr:DUF4258 domain-containing protein [Oscillospiraceae bacterium]